jgi:hypothetical protein
VSTGGLRVKDARTDREATLDEIEAAEEHEEMAERGARQKGEGRLP